MKSGPVQTLPPGLLSLLALKNAGANPREFEDFIQPTFDMRELMSMANRTWVTDTFVIALGLTTNFVGQLFTTGTLKVPFDEIWYVWNASVNIQPINAADAITGPLVPVIVAPNGLMLSVLGSGSYSTNVGQGPLSAGKELRRWMTGGSQLGFGLVKAVIAGAGTACTVQGWLEVTKFKI